MVYRGYGRLCLRFDDFNFFGLAFHKRNNKETRDIDNPIRRKLI
jgi:hypothetical protein